jgi:hypothetical protein
MTDTPMQPRRTGRLIEWLTGLHLPFRGGLHNHPILRLDLKRSRWLQPDPRARLHGMFWRTIRRVVIVALLLVIIDLITVIGSLRTSGRTIYYSDDLPSSYVIFGAMLLLFGMLVIGDFFYLIRSLKAITPERASGHWDMVRLMPMHPKTILDAKYAAVQLQSWRILLIEYIPRLFLLFAAPPYLLLSNIQYRTYSYPSIFRWSDLANVAGITLFFLIILLEAGWRMRALTAIGLALSSRSRSLTTNFVVGFMAVVALHIGQFLTLIFTANVFSLVWYAFVARIVPEIIRNNVSEIAHLLTLGVLNFTLLYIVRRIAYRSALRRAFKDI